MFLVEKMMLSRSKWQSTLALQSLLCGFCSLLVRNFDVQNTGTRVAKHQPLGTSKWIMPDQISQMLRPFGLPGSCHRCVMGVTLKGHIVGK